MITARHPSIAAAAAALLFSCASQPAAAWMASRSSRAIAEPPLEGLQPGLFDADGRACIKQCPDDRLPCDPPAFKTADGRCSDQWR